jgi:hypothetical protein
MTILSDVIDEIPFARRAREEGRPFSGGKPDGEYPYMAYDNLSGADYLSFVPWPADISVLVAVISPADSTRR